MTHYFFLEVNVRNKQDVVNEARREGENVHFAILMELGSVPRVVVQRPYEGAFRGSRHAWCPRL